MIKFRGAQSPDARRRDIKPGAIKSRGAESGAVKDGVASPKTSIMDNEAL